MPEQPRYAITDPVPGGYDYYNVIDRESAIMENFAIVTIWAGLPDARRIALHCLQLIVAIAQEQHP